MRVKRESFFYRTTKSTRHLMRADKMLKRALASHRFSTQKPTFKPSWTPGEIPNYPTAKNKQKEEETKQTFSTREIIPGRETLQSGEILQSALKNRLDLETRKRIDEDAMRKYSVRKGRGDTFRID